MSAEVTIMPTTMTLLGREERGRRHREGSDPRQPRKAQCLERAARRRDKHAASDVCGACAFGSTSGKSRTPATSYRRRDVAVDSGCRRCRTASTDIATITTTIIISPLSSKPGHPSMNRCNCKEYLQLLSTTAEEETASSA